MPWGRFLRRMGLAVALGIASRAGAGHAQVPPQAAEKKEEPPARAERRPVPLRGVEPGGDRSDLAPLRAIIGNARVVAVGQQDLDAREPLAFRNRLLEYLVEEMEFTAIAVESAFPESRRLADYVAGGPGTAEEVLAGCRTWSPQPVEENAELVRWLRARNTGAGNSRRPVRFYAIDLSYTGPWGSWPGPSAIEAALAYLARVDPASARPLAARFEPWLPRLANPGARPTPPEHDTLTAAIADLVALLERERIAYLAAAPEADYAWAHRAAVTARQADNMFRVAPSGPSGGPVPPEAWRMVNAREAAMAENILWALGREGPAGRVLVMAHNVHVQSAPTAGGPWDAYERMPASMGQNLRVALGDDLVVIGTSEAKSAARFAEAPFSGEDMTEALQNAGSRPLLFPFPTGRPGAAFDALLVVDAFTPARVIRPPR